MTAADICGLTGCGQCRTLHQCRRRCGLEPEAARILPPPASRKHRAAIGPFDVLAILILFGLPVGCLHMAGAF